MEGTALVFLLFPIGRVLSLLRLWSLIHRSLGLPRTHSPAVRSIHLSISFTIALFAIPLYTFLVAAFLRSGRGLPFSMHSSQTACLLNRVSLWTSATMGCQDQGCDWNYLRLLPSFPAIFQHRRPLNSTINAPLAQLYQCKHAFNIGDATRIPVPRSPLTKSTMHQGPIDTLTV